MHIIWKLYSVPIPMLVSVAVRKRIGVGWFLSHIFQLQGPQQAPQPVQKATASTWKIN